MLKLNRKVLKERNGVLFLKIENPALKNEIFLKKEVILEALREKLGNKSLKDLRF